MNNEWVDMRHSGRMMAALIAACIALLCGPAAAAWQPTRPVELIVAAGTSGGADQLARVLQGTIAKYNVLPTSAMVVNKAGGAGGEGFLDIKCARGNPHKLVITLSNLLTTPLATGIPVNWKDDAGGDAGAG